MRTALATSFPLFALAMLVGTPSLTQGQESVETRLTVDEERLKKNLAQKPAGVPMAEILESGLALSHESERAEPLVILAYRLRDGEKVAEFESRPFTVSPGRTIRPRAAYLPPDRFYGNNGQGKRFVSVTGFGTFIPDEENAQGERFVSVTGFGTFIPAQRVIQNPAEAASRMYKRGEWTNGDAVYLIAVPADPELRKYSHAQPSPLLIFETKPTTRP